MSMNTLPKPSVEPYKVVWSIPVPCLSYDGEERVYALCGYRYRRFFFIYSLHELPNVSPFPEQTFSVLTRDVVKVEGSLTPPESVLGYVHTHPNGYPEPSVNDIEGISKSMIGLVVSDGFTHQWYTRKGSIRPLVYWNY
jgi:proteasome lid subunit RPN8/RPN11